MSNLPLSIFVAVQPNLYRQLFSSEADQHLRQLGHVQFQDQEQPLTSEALASIIGSYDVVVTGWRTPRFTEAVLQASQRLRLVAHSAGSIKFMLDEGALDCGFQVSSAAAAMGRSVAEFALMATMLLLRPIHQLDRAMKGGQDWASVKAAGTGLHELSGQRVGIVGTGHVGRSFIRLLRALNVEVWAYDPYLKEEQAAALDIERASTLEMVLRHCRVVSLHSAATPATHHLIGRRELSMLCDGALLINTARSWLVDPDALLAELRSGRIAAALDVFDEEPLPVDSPWRKLDNVLITPHIGAATFECYQRLGDITVQEIARLRDGQPLRHAIRRDQMPMIA
jgi:phosphoglycerate dehydrogenase-like enzyme